MRHNFNNNFGYRKRPGLKGPFTYPSGHVLYYDPQEGRYWDPRTDFYLEDQEVNELKNQWFSRISG